MSSLKEISNNRCFGGDQKIFTHLSEELKCEMKFAIYLPPEIENGEKVPVIYWLSGLTCNETNFVQKAGAQQHASAHGFIIVCPDTSPRGCNIPGEDEGWDFGTGAGFYVDSTQEPWKNHYRMYSYVTEELPDLIIANFPVDSKKQGIMGHSMGGHGALICALKNPGKYASVSAFAPICHPTQCAWGKKAFSGYLGSKEEDIQEWENWDATCLVKKYDGPPLEIFVDQGTSDNFLKDGQLQPDIFFAACTEAKIPVILKKRENYDHSYFYIATFIKEHFDYHAMYLKSA